MYKNYLYIIYLFLFILFCSLSFNGGDLKFLYGGKKGGKYGGTAKVEYYLKIGSKYNKIDLNSNKIDLNDYGENIQLAVRISDLQVGLKKDCSELRNKTEQEICQLKALFDLTNKDAVIPVSQDAVIIGAKSRVDLKSEADLVYNINATIQSEKSFTLKTPLKIFDKYNREWDIPTISKNFVITPKKTKPQTDNVKNSNLNTVQQQNTNSESENIKAEEVYPNIQTAFNQQDTANLILNCKLYLSNCEHNITKNCSEYESILCLLLHYNFVELEMYEEKYLNKYPNGLCYAKVREKVEQKSQNKLYTAIITAVQSNDSSALQKCKNYICEHTDDSFVNCNQYENVLNWQMDLETDFERVYLEKTYQQLFPNGKYLDKILQRIEDRKPKYFPIKKGIAKIDFDSKVIAVNKVLGGKKPYYLELFDYSKSSQYAIKRNRFNKSYFSIPLESLNIPPGNYTVNVVDDIGEKFVVQDGIYIGKPFTIPKTFKLLFVILFGIIIFALYKRYIFF